jgi:hypothetical protein
VLVYHPDSYRDHLFGTFVQSLKFKVQSSGQQPSTLNLEL